MPDFVIHIGPHKTGSTYLQSILAGLAEPLLEQYGILFPQDQGLPAHSELPRKIRAIEARPAATAEIAAYVASGCRTVLITAEGLVAMPRRQILAFKEMIGDHPVRIVFYVRSAADIVVSSWGEQVKHGSCQTLDALVRATMAAPQVAMQVNFDLVLKNWVNAFGKASIGLVSLESLAQHKLDTVIHFAENFLGIGALPSRDGIKVMRNEAFPLVDLEMIRAVNEIRKEREGVADGVLRRRFRRMRRTLKFPVVAKSAEAAQATMQFDETTPRMRALQQSLFTTYGAGLVAPHHADRFYTARIREVTYIDPSYRSVPGVKEEIEAVYRQLMAPA